MNQRTRAELSRMGWALRALAERDETEDQLRLLFDKTQEDSTPQERRALAREIALLIPDENEAIRQGRPDPLWLQVLRTFARRNLELVYPALDSPPRVALNEEDDAAATGAGKPSKLASSGGKGGRPAISPAKARGRLLAATRRFRDGRDETEPLTNVRLAKAIKRNEETISNWLKRAEWTLEDLDVEWARRGRKKPE